MQYTFDWGVLLTYKGLLLQGLWLTIKLAVFGFVFSTIFGVLLGVGRISRNRAIRFLATSYVEFFRNIPLIVHIFFLYFGLGLGSFASGLIGIVLYSSAFMAEVVRAGIQSIPKTQYEAAYAAGLSRFNVIRYVILPQAIAIVLPPLATEFVNLIKNTAIALTVGVEELTFMTQEIDSATFRGFEAATAATVIYTILCMSILRAVAMLEKHLKIETKLI